MTFDSPHFFITACSGLKEFRTKMDAENVDYTGFGWPYVGDRLNHAAIIHAKTNFAENRKRKLFFDESLHVRQLSELSLVQFHFITRLSWLLASFARNIPACSDVRAIKNELSALAKGINRSKISSASSKWTGKIFLLAREISCMTVDIKD